MFLMILGLLAKILPSAIGAPLQAWVLTIQNKNTQEMKDNVQAQRVQDSEDTMERLIARAAAGDVKAQEEIRRRESE
jgi:hypothetical protein